MSSKCPTAELHPPAQWGTAPFAVITQQGDVSQTLLGQENSTAGLGESYKSAWSVKGQHMSLVASL